MPTECKTATELFDEVKNLSNVEREKRFIANVFEGNVPSHLKSFIEIKTIFLDSSKNERELMFYVLSDYLSIGNDDDFIRIPLTPIGAQVIADNINCIMPTTKLVDIIWTKGVKIPPQPWGPPYDATMSSTKRIVDHNEKINKTINELGYDSSQLLVGHKKDVVITRKLEKTPKQVAIYGWHQLNSKPIQPLYLGHDCHYLDYSHGHRFCSRICFLDDNEDDLGRILCDENLCLSISNEGAFKSFRQP